MLMENADRISIKSPAKVNLCLKILGERSDGYHDIFSVMQAVNLFDEIVIEKSKKFSTSVSGIKISGKNIVDVAYEKLCEFLGWKPEVSVRILKKIPVGAGLGGGSSNAAFFLMGMNKLFNLRLSVRQLMKIGASVGSDVPFFFSGGSAIVRGRGEIVESIELPTNYYIVLIAPDFPINTKWAYSQFRNSLTSAEKIKYFSKLSSQNFFEKISDFENDFEKIIFEKFFDISKAILLMRDLGAALALVSGSGSSFFGIFKNRDDAQAAYNMDWAGKKFLLHPISYDLS
ncbi:4-(cytidine 5'-diphospho)-2-C-methyl-D-erythritol kinase [bacterium]|nr:4-(cytidine 5'-diphospho)-2-C-methyl-D-erythritol kinase [bacterium]